MMLNPRLRHELAMNGLLVMSMLTVGTLLKSCGIVG
jgi:hypothetical protein